jgi:O-antigen/teichoic acid export membrane protein
VTAAERPPLLSHLKKLLTHSAVYGAADVMQNVIGLLLIPIFTRLLTLDEYGAVALLGLFSSLAKIVFRLGLESAFFRLHYDQPDEPGRRRLAGTAAMVAAGTGGLLFGLVWLAGTPLTHAVFGQSVAPHEWLLLAAADIYVAALSFVPQVLLRIQDRPRLFSAFNLLRQLLNLSLKVALVKAGLGVTGVLCSDLIATGVFALLLFPILARHASWIFSPRLAGELLGLGLPRVPHGFMLQVQNFADRRLLEHFANRDVVGLYSVGYTFGSAVKFALSAFEPAWQPFVYAQIGKPDGRQTLARLATYVLAAFTFVTLGVAVLGREVVVLLTAPPFHAAAPVVPIVALAYLLHGVFLLTSIGINIQKKARYYPLVTLVSATTNVALNLALIPRLGMIGAAWATVASYAVMAAIGVWLSQRLYPLPFETGRLVRVAAGAVAVYALSLLAPEDFWSAVAVKGALLLTFPALLLLTMGVTPGERQALGAWLRLRR